MVVYDGAAVEMLFAIGEGHRVIGTHSYVTYPPETASIPKIGDAFNMDIEAIVALEPDLVYVFYDRFNEDLERAGLKVLYIKSLSDGFTEVANQIRMWGLITGGTGGTGEAGKLAGKFDARVAAIEERLDDVESAKTIYSHGLEWWTPGRKTLVNDVFELLKLQNIADFEGYQQISPEVVVAADPSIIMGDPAGVTGEVALAGLDAVADGNIFTFSEGNSFSVAGPRFMDAVEEMAAWVYPELFP
jgi:iron complex transport system substrate-binding protein